MATTLRATTVTTSGGNTYKPSEVVGTDPWGDGSNATYSRVWLSERSSVSIQERMHGFLEAFTGDTATVEGVTFDFRLGLKNEGSATDTIHTVSIFNGDAWLTDLGNYRVTWAPDGTPHDISWPVPTGSLAAVVSALAAGTAKVGLWRNTPKFKPVSDYGITVYDLAVQVAHPDPPTDLGYPRRGPRLYPLKSQQWTARRGPGSFY